MSDVPSLLQPLKDRLAAATEGPWVTRDLPMPGASVDEWFSREIVHPNAGFHPFNVLKVRGASNAARECCWPPNNADATFIAAAPTDQAKLIAAVESAEQSFIGRAESYRETADRLNQQVIDRDPDRDPEAAARYSHYASAAESALQVFRVAITSALESAP